METLTDVETAAIAERAKLKGELAFWFERHRCVLIAVAAGVLGLVVGHFIK
jgi:hypothetical protein